MILNFLKKYWWVLAALVLILVTFGQFFLTDSTPAMQFPVGRDFSASFSMEYGSALYDESMIRAGNGMTGVVEMVGSEIHFDFDHLTDGLSYDLYINQSGMAQFIVNNTELICGPSKVTPVGDSNTLVVHMDTTCGQDVFKGTFTFTFLPQ